ncbi:MAG: hypothetical protein ABIQ88_08690 [Chitinophagaceae bacterium]
MKENKGGCCTDEHKQVKLDTEHQKITDLLLFQLSQPAVWIDSFSAFSGNEFYIVRMAPLTTTAADIPKERRYLLHCVLRV